MTQMTCVFISFHFVSSLVFLLSGCQYFKNVLTATFFCIGSYVTQAAEGPQLDSSWFFLFLAKINLMVK